VKGRMPPKPCLRCGKSTYLRRDGRPVCLYCRVVLNELNADKEARKMGKLKGSRGRL